MPQTDFIPQNPSAFVVWFTKFILHLQNLAPKYELCSEKIDALLRDHEWVHHWAWMRSDLRAREKRRHGIFTAGGDGKTSEIRFAAPIQAAAEAQVYIPDRVLPGIKERIRELVRCIKSQKHIYTKEDGSLLGILTPEEAGWIEEDYTPDMKFRTLSGFRLEVDFRKFGLDALRFEYRYIRGEWHFGGFLTKSPDVLKIPPRIGGAEQQIEIRAVFWNENRNYGNWSPIYRLVIAP
ncbi:MAG TPA: hypothetical protein VIL74_21745 [Pyrinomonadaceae bacterium]|jgi:hypothetical protein